MDKQELYQKTEKALNQAFEAAKQSAKVLSEKAGEAAHVTKLLIQKASVEHKVSKKFTEIGHKVFEVSLQGEKSISLEDEELKKLIDETKSLDQELSQVENKIESEQSKKAES